MGGIIGRQLGAEALQDGDFRGAVVHFSNAILVVKDVREKAQLQTLLGYCQLKVKKYDEAQQLLVEAARVLPDENAKFDSRMPSLMALKHSSELPGNAHDELERTYRVVLALGHPEYVPRAQLNLGAIEYNVKGRGKVARELWEQAYQASAPDATKARVTYNLGWYWEHEGDRKRARQYYHEARRIWPEGEEMPDRLAAERDA
ncbi:tetratricopeptide repeat protein [Kibdelosporangium persicum]|nr:tetratricopeptide repeat protein [Kibdelosporangium persicum]